MSRFKFRYISQQQQFLRALSAGIGKTAVILPAAFLTESALGVLTLGMVFYTREVYLLAPGTVGWVAATWQSCYALGCLLMRPAFESLRPRYSMIASTVGMSLAVAAILLCHSVALTFVFYGLFGFCLSFFWPPLMSWMSLEIEGKSLGRAMSRLTLSGNAGIIISPFVAGALSTLSPRYPLYAAVLILLINTILLTAAALLLPKIRSDQHRGRSRNNTQHVADRSTPLRFPAWAGLFVTFTVLGVIVTVFPMYARDELLLEKSTIGILLLGRALMTAACFLIVGRTTFWHFNAVPMTTTLIALALLVLGLSVFRSPAVLALILMLIGPATALGFSYSFFHGASGASNRAKRMAIHEALLATGLICGSAVGGQIYEHFSMGVVGVFGAVLLTAAAAAQIVLVRLNRSKVKR